MLGVSIDGRKTTTTKALERVLNATQLIRFLRVENINTDHMTPNALRCVVQTVVMSTATYGIHLCPKTKELDDAWAVLEEEVAQMVLGTRMKGKAITMRLLTKLPSLNELQRMRRGSLKRRIERRAQGDDTSAVVRGDPKALRMAKVVLRAQGDLGKKEWVIATKRACQQRKRIIPHTNGKRPPMFTILNSKLVRNCARWYSGTFPTNPERLKRNKAMEIRKTYERVTLTMEKEVWTAYDRVQVSEGMKIIEDVSRQQWETARRARCCSNERAAHGN